MKFPMIGMLLVLLCSVVRPSESQLLSGLPDGFYSGGHFLPLAVLSDHPLSVTTAVTRVPLIAVPQREMATIDNAHISSVSPTEPLVTCQFPKFSLDATPAVRLVLDEPLLMGGPAAEVGFPSRLSVALGGLRISLPVGALLAPVQSPNAPSNIIRVLYAVPTSPLFLRYPYYPLPALTVPQPSPYYPNYRPSGTLLNPIEEEKKPQRPLVTVLDFPESLGRPQSLHYQPTVEGELGNRGPPEAVIPAGIVQSAQPRPLLTPFFNSKESPILQTLRDEAEKHRVKSGGVEEAGVEVL